MASPSIQAAQAMAGLNNLDAQSAAAPTFVFELDELSDSEIDLDYDCCDEHDDLERNDDDPNELRPKDDTPPSCAQAHNPSMTTGSLKRKFEDPSRAYRFESDQHGLLTAPGSDTKVAALKHSQRDNDHDRSDAPLGVVEKTSQTWEVPNMYACCSPTAGTEEVESNEAAEETGMKTKARQEPVPPINLLGTVGEAAESPDKIAGLETNGVSPDDRGASSQKLSEIMSMSEGTKKDGMDTGIQWGVPSISGPISPGCISDASLGLDLGTPDFERKVSTTRTKSNKMRTKNNNEKGSGAKEGLFADDGVLDEDNSHLNWSPCPVAHPEKKKKITVLEARKGFQSFDEQSVRVGTELLGTSPMRYGISGELREDAPENRYSHGLGRLPTVASDPEKNTLRDGITKDGRPVSERSQESVEIQKEDGTDDVMMKDPDEFGRRFTSRRDRVSGSFHKEKPVIPIDSTLTATKQVDGTSNKPDKEPDDIDVLFGSIADNLEEEIRIHGRLVSEESIRTWKEIGEFRRELDDFNGTGDHPPYPSYEEKKATSDIPPQPAIEQGGPAFPSRNSGGMMPNKPYDPWWLHDTSAVMTPCCADSADVASDFTFGRTNLQAGDESGARSYLSVVCTTIQVVQPGRVLLVWHTNFHPGFDRRFQKASIVCRFLRPTTPPSSSTSVSSIPMPGPPRAASVLMHAPRKAYGGYTREQRQLHWGVELPLKVSAGPASVGVKPHVAVGTAKEVDHSFTITGSARGAPVKTNCVWTVEENSSSKRGIPSEIQFATLLDYAGPFVCEVDVAARTAGLFPRWLKTKASPEQRRAPIDPAKFAGSSLRRYEVGDGHSALHTMFNGWTGEVEGALLPFAQPVVSV